MRVIGLFRELGTHIYQEIPSIKSMVGGLSEDDAGMVVNYLKRGVPVFDVMGATNDPLNKSVYISGGPSLVSDGFWIWRGDLIYFVEKYRINLPYEFLQYVAYENDKSIDAAAVLKKSAEILDLYEKAEQGVGLY